MFNLVMIYLNVPDWNFIKNQFYYLFTNELYYKISDILVLCFSTFRYIIALFFSDNLKNLLSLGFGYDIVIRVS